MSSLLDMHFFFRPSNDRVQGDRSDVLETERVYRRHDENIRQLPVLQSQRIAVLQMRGIVGGVFRKQDQIFPRQAIRKQQVKIPRIFSIVREPNYGSREPLIDRSQL